MSAKMSANVSTNETEIIKPELNGRGVSSNTKYDAPKNKNYFRANRFHLVLNPGKEAPYFSKHYYLMYKYTNLIKYLTKFKSFRYLISGYGLPEHETPNNHIHIYVEYKETTRLYITKVYGAHIITQIDSQLNTIQYVKDQECGMIEEIGKKALCHRPSIKEAEQMSIDELKELSIDYSNIVKRIMLEKYNDMDIDNDYKGEKLKVYYICGPSGIGKSRRARQILKHHGYKHYDNIQHKGEFYIGVSGKNKACIYDDFRPSDMPVNEFIHFIDYYINNLNVKGGSYKNIYELIVITSVIDPRKIYKDCVDNDETRTQWIRRMIIIIFEENGIVRRIENGEEEYCMLYTEEIIFK